MFNLGSSYFHVPLTTVRHQLIVVQYKMERAWILSMIADGLREHLDYKICEKRFAVKILLTFYDSPLADSQTEVTAFPVV